MQVFVIGSIYYTAQTLDKKRLHKQIVECNQILNAINGISTAWKNHPCVLQYKTHTKWLETYRDTLIAYRDNDIKFAKQLSEEASRICPFWHTQTYYNQMKRRLYTKDTIHYKQFASYGTSDINWYFVNGEWKKYLHGKVIKNE